MEEDELLIHTAELFGQSGETAQAMVSKLNSQFPPHGAAMLKRLNLIMMPSECHLVSFLSLASEPGCSLAAPNHVTTFVLDNIDCDTMHMDTFSILANKLPGLSSLVLRLSCTTVPSLQPLAQLQHLTELVISTFNQSPAAIRSLVQLSQLRGLELDLLELQVEDAEALKQLGQLTRLDVKIDVMEDLDNSPSAQQALAATLPEVVHHLTSTHGQLKYAQMDVAGDGIFDYDVREMQQATQLVVTSPGLSNLCHFYLQLDAAATAKLFESSPNIVSINVAMLDLTLVPAEKLQGIKHVGISVVRSPYPVRIFATLLKLPVLCQLHVHGYRSGLILDAVTAFSEQDCKDVCSVLSRVAYIDKKLLTVLLTQRRRKKVEQGFRDLPAGFELEIRNA